MDCLCDDHKYRHSKHAARLASLAGLKTGVVCQSGWRPALGPPGPELRLSAPMTAALFQVVMPGAGWSRSSTGATGRRASTGRSG